jgi:hypothetical protein
MDSENTPQKSVPLLSLGLSCSMLLFPVVLVVAMFLPSYQLNSDEVSRDELPRIMNLIVHAEKALQKAKGVYISAAPYPLAPSQEPQLWDSSLSGGFEILDFEPESSIRGSYSVTITEDDFQVLGISDIDGDGVFATYVATKDKEPSLLTPEEVY